LAWLACREKKLGTGFWYILEYYQLLANQAVLASPYITCAIVDPPPPPQQIKSKLFIFFLLSLLIIPFTFLKEKPTHRRQTENIYAKKITLKAI
jgi:hypothetical protein